MAPKILIATTTWWAMPARIALAFAQSGALVSGVFPGGSPLEKLRSLQDRYCYSATFSVNSLRKAIEAVEPDLIVPCDDRVVGHLHELYADSLSRRSEKLCRLIERSQGNPSGFAVSVSRSKLLHFAQQSGIRVPQTRVIHGFNELKIWLHGYGFPAVLKQQGTWGGSGVRVMRSLVEAEKAFNKLTRSLSFSSFVSCISFHDFYPLFQSVRNEDRELIVQTYIDGVPSNVMFACWEGEVLDALTVEVLFSQEKLGASTIVRTASNSQMEQAGRIIAKALGMTGFFGLDFIVEEATGDPYLIELNPRATQIGHLEPAGGRSLVSTLYQQLAGVPAPGLNRLNGETIAFFPQSLQCNLDSRTLPLADMRHDIPWEEPALMKELMRGTWNNRRRSALLYFAVQRAFRSPAANSVRRITRRLVSRVQRYE